WKIRKLGNDLLSLNSNIKDKFGSQYDDHSRLVGTTAMELISLLDIAHISGLVSFMNARVLKDELVGLVKEIVENQNDNLYTKGFLLEQSFFDISRELADQSIQRQKINIDVTPKYQKYQNQNVNKKDNKNESGSESKNQSVNVLKEQKGQPAHRQGGIHAGT